MTPGHSIPGGDEVAPGVFAPDGALRLQFSRSGGPGGQNVNKLNTKAELWVSVDQLIGLRPGAVNRLCAAAGRRLTASREIHLVSESERGQEANKALVMQRLRELIVHARVEPKVRRKSKPSRAAKARRLDAKKHRGKIKSLRRGQMEN